jgi:hypothetical protein
LHAARGVTLERRLRAPPPHVHQLEEERAPHGPPDPPVLDLERRLVPPLLLDDALELGDLSLLEVLRLELPLLPRRPTLRQCHPRRPTLDLLSIRLPSEIASYVCLYEDGSVGS